MTRKPDDLDLMVLYQMISLQGKNQMLFKQIEQGYYGSDLHLIVDGTLVTGLYSDSSDVKIEFIVLKDDIKHTLDDNITHLKGSVYLGPLDFLVNGYENNDERKEENYQLALRLWRVQKSKLQQETECALYTCGKTFVDITNRLESPSFDSQPIKPTRLGF